MRILLVRPPRYPWTFNSETWAFWQPLGLLPVASGQFAWPVLEWRLA